MPIRDRLGAIHSSHGEWSADLAQRISRLREIAASGSHLAQSILLKIEMNQNSDRAQRLGAGEPARRDGARGAQTR